MKLDFSLKFFLLLSLSTVFSCSEEFISQPEYNEETNTKVASESTDTVSSNTDKRSVRYELDGDFSGKLDITFLSSEGFNPPDQIIGTTVPWQTSYDIPHDTQAIGGFANGLYEDANPNEMASLKLFLDDSLIETVVRTADEDGKITLPLESYHLEFDKSGKTISDEHIGKDITYTVDGNFSGNIMLVYKVADGNQENILISELPWQYTFQTTSSSYRSSIYGLGSNGIKEQELEFSLSIDETIFKSERVTADVEGRIGLLPEIFLEFD